MEVRARGTRVGAHHDLEGPVDQVLGHRLVEQVAHAVDEDAPGLAPAEREGQQIGVERDGEAVPVAGIAHRVETDGESFGVTVLAPRADLCAARDGAPGGVRPFDAGVFTHAESASCAG
jgi:hypothetical protein